MSTEEPSSETSKRQISVRDIIVIVVVLGLVGFAVFRNLNREEPTPVEPPASSEGGGAGMIAQ
jgi:hypothetical protein